MDQDDQIAIYKYLKGNRNLNTLQAISNHGDASHETRNATGYFIWRDRKKQTSYNGGSL